MAYAPAVHRGILEKILPLVLGRELHHYPNVGGITEYNKHQDWYLETLKLYLLVFKENPDPDCWRIPQEILPICYPDPVVPALIPQGAGSNGS